VGVGVDAVVVTRQDRLVIVGEVGVLVVGGGILTGPVGTVGVGVPVRVVSVTVWPLPSDTLIPTRGVVAVVVVVGALATAVVTVGALGAGVVTGGLTGVVWVLTG